MNERDYFACLGLPRSYALDMQTLKTQYLMQQKAAHPDNFVTQGDAEKKTAQQQSAELNAAYQVLSCPLKRAQYLLNLEGVSAAVLPPAFLMEQMTLQEEISDSSDRNAITAIKAHVIAAIDKRERAFAACFEKTPIDWQNAAEVFAEWQFYAKSKERVALL